ncbi:hypothetical protein GOP47_0002883 [Adiantum capillus-veneris]|uniref:Uncharacterized protein n=1 Tax=Adiantum capillus-veneris TaxID=13818 RepID=A0A9D4ZS06_ADICA|nr:hypothetical protein GOP47_0002883 [Adiantum capillus-veneris]
MGRAAGVPLCLMNRPFRLRPSLVELCVPILSRQPGILDLLASLPADICTQVIAKLPLDLPLLPCSQFILDKDYWKRRALLKWKTCDPSRHGHSWKQLFFECNLAEALENYDPTLEDGTILMKLMETSEPFVRSLEIRQLPSRLSMCIVFKLLGRQLITLKLEYGWRNAGMLYEPDRFGMKVSDCLAFSASICLASALTVLDLSCNLLDDEKIKILLEGMTLNPGLLQLSLCHNRIGDLGVAEISKFLMFEKCVLTGLNLGDNYLSSQGAKDVAEALKTNTVLNCLNLGYNNKVGDEGGRAIFDALQSNTVLQGLSLISCGLGEEAAASLGRLISSSSSSLLYLDVSANPSIGTKGGATLQASMESGKPPLYFDVEMCGVGEEIEQFIANAMTTKNEKDVRPSLLRNSIFQI